MKALIWVVTVWALSGCTVHVHSAAPAAYVQPAPAHVTPRPVRNSRLPAAVTRQRPTVDVSPAVRRVRSEVAERYARNSTDVSPHSAPSNGRDPSNPTTLRPSVR